MVLLVGPPGRPGPWVRLGVGAAAVLGGGAAVIAWRDPTARSYFLVVVAVAFLDVALLMMAGHRL